MVKADDVDKIHYGMQALKELERQYNNIEDSTGHGMLGITIQSQYQDDSFVDAVRPAVLGELARRIDDKRLELEKLGVSFAE